jgi:hypothetical protein
VERHGLRGVLEVYGSLVKIHGGKDSKRPLKSQTKKSDIRQLHSCTVQKTPFLN